MAEFMHEMVCPGCGRTAHITWDGTGPDRRILNISECLKRIAEVPPTFECADCGARQQG
jgi:hypothetical protein